MPFTRRSEICFFSSKGHEPRSEVYSFRNWGSAGNPCNFIPPRNTIQLNATTAIFTNVHGTKCEYYKAINMNKTSTESLPSHTPAIYASNKVLERTPAPPRAMKARVMMNARVMRRKILWWLADTLADTLLNSASTPLCRSSSATIDLPSTSTTTHLPAKQRRLPA